MEAGNASDRKMTKALSIMWVVLAACVPIGAAHADTANAAASVAAPPRWVEAPMKSLDAGYVTLRWQALVSSDGASFPESRVTFQLQEASEPDFSDAVVRYEGSERQSFISGLANGDYFFRVRGRPASDVPWSDWSEVKTLQVVHHSRTFAMTMFGVGSVVFLAIVLTIWRGNRVQAVTPRSASARAASEPSAAPREEARVQGEGS